MKSILFCFFTLFMSQLTWADYSYRSETELSSHDYLLKDRGRKDPVFDEYRKIELGLDLGIGSDCGKIDFQSSLKATLKNLLDTKYFGDMGKDILAGSPMLVTCYFSPTWCSILKHTRLNANFISQMRLDQCSIMDKYVDSRTEDFYQERQKCVHRALQSNGGNMENAMRSCGSKSVYDYDLANWAGNKDGEQTTTNKLIESSAKWAGFDGEESGDVVKLVKSLVGDTVVSRGNVTVEYGPRKFALTPRSHLQKLQDEIEAKLCHGVLVKIDKAQDKYPESIVTDDDLKEISGSKSFLIDRQTVRYLSLLPLRKRSVYCEKISKSIALSRFSRDMNQSIDLLTIAEQNPNLPDKRKSELRYKRESLKDSIDMTLSLHRERNEPLNRVMAQISSEGRRFQDRANARALDLDSAGASSGRVRATLFDCSDQLLCNLEKN